MKKTRKDKSFVKNPYYEGGIAAMKSFVKKHRTYPEAARTNKIEGRVRVRYKIDYLGNVVEAKVIAGIGYGCDEEAMRIVKLLKFIVPKNRGLRIHFFKTITINFKMSKASPSVAQSTINYQISPAKKEKLPNKSSSSGTYSYTIDI